MYMHVQVFSLREKLNQNKSQSKPGKFQLILLDSFYCLMLLVLYSIKDMDVKDPMPNAKAPVIVRKVESHKDIVLLDVS